MASGNSPGESFSRFLVPEGYVVQANRGLREDSLILTRIDKVKEFRFNYEILKSSGNYLIITIGAD